MSDINSAESTLVKMVDLLRFSGIGEWADALDKCRQELSAKPVEIGSKMLSMYGGMGSLNDVILYKDGQPLSKENSEFDDLRTDLYDLCQKIIKSN